MAPRRPRRWQPVLALLAATGLVVSSGLVTAVPSGAEEEPATYTNPVSTGFTRDFADPTVIRGRDGWYYAYATNGRRQVGEERQLMMISRSRDLVDWQWVGPVFTPETMPRYDGQPEDVNRQFWAPEITYLDGRYVLYYSYVVNTPGEEPFSVIAAATADHPAGPWTDSGAAVIGPERWEPRPGSVSGATSSTPRPIGGRTWNRSMKRTRSRPPFCPTLIAVPTPRSLRSANHSSPTVHSPHTARPLDCAHPQHAYWRAK